MQMVIDRADRRLLLIAGGVFALLLCAVVLLMPGAGENAGATPSSYSSGPGGARAAYLLLQELGLPVERWEDSPAGLPTEPSAAVLIVADPASAPNTRERADLRSFVQRGGTILITGPRAGDFFAEMRLIQQPFNAQMQTFSAIFPDRFTRGADIIVLRPAALWEGIAGTQVVLYGDPEHAVAVSWRVGNGRVLWWAGPEPLTNAGISQVGNLNLLLNTVSGAPTGPAPPQKIYWDEYFHGQRRSLWAYVAGTPMVWGIVQLALLGVAIFSTFGRRAGPVVPGPVTSRLWPLEFVDMLGGLYERAGATQAAVGIVYRNFRAVLTRRLRLPVTIPDAALGQAIDKRLGGRISDVSRTLSLAEAASRGDKIEPSQALALVQELEDCRKQFEPSAPQRQEKP
jgi:Domain of unknown function (DUF4350)